MWLEWFSHLTNTFVHCYWYYDWVFVLDFVEIIHARAIYWNIWINWNFAQCENMKMWKCENVCCIRIYGRIDQKPIFKKTKQKKKKETDRNIYREYILKCIHNPNVNVYQSWKNIHWTFANWRLIWKWETPRIWIYEYSITDTHMIDIAEWMVHID